MSTLSVERLRQDELELHYYGICSTQIYISYREFIDDRLKVLMLELEKFYLEMSEDNPQTIREKLLEQYKTFWTEAEPRFQQFYDEIQLILALPKDFVPKDFVSPQEVLYDPELTKLEKELQNLEEEYLKEKYYLEALRQRKELLENTFLPVMDKIDEITKIEEDIKDKATSFDALNAKWNEKYEICKEDFDKYSCFRMLKGLRTQDKE